MSDYRIQIARLKNVNEARRIKDALQKEYKQADKNKDFRAKKDIEEQLLLVENWIKRH